MWRTYRIKGSSTAFVENSIVRCRTLESTDALLLCKLVVGEQTPTTQGTMLNMRPVARQHLEEIDGLEEVPRD